MLEGTLYNNTSYLILGTRNYYGLSHNIDCEILCSKPLNHSLHARWYIQQVRHSACMPEARAGMVYLRLCAQNDLYLSYSTFQTKLASIIYSDGMEGPFATVLA